MDLYQTITDRIVSAIERGAGEWRMPWHTATDNIALPHNVTGRAYRGVNVLLLWAAAEASGYDSPLWATYKQWQERGAQIRKGEKATIIIFWKRTETALENEESEDDETRTRLIARAYSVFNAAQVDGFEPKEPVSLATGPERIDTVEAFFQKVGADVRYGGDKVFYAPAGDYIQIPELRQFDAADRYYSTLAHEHVHWTGAKHRCARDLGRRFGAEAYALEELIAELGVAFLCADLRLSNEPREDHAAYVAHWLKVLKNDKRAIFTAASKAQAAVDYLER